MKRTQVNVWFVESEVSDERGGERGEWIDARLGKTK